MPVDIRIWKAFCGTLVKKVIWGSRPGRDQMNTTKDIRQVCNVDHCHGLFQLWVVSWVNVSGTSGTVSMSSYSPYSCGKQHWNPFVRARIEAYEIKCQQWWREQVPGYRQPIKPGGVSTEIQHQYSDQTGSNAMQYCHDYCCTSAKSMRTGCADRCHWSSNTLAWRSRNCEFCPRLECYQRHWRWQ